MDVDVEDEFGVAIANSFSCFRFRDGVVDRDVEAFFGDFDFFGVLFLILSSVELSCTSSTTTSSSTSSFGLFLLPFGLPLFFGVFSFESVSDVVG